MPSCNTYHLTWVSLTLAWGISSQLLRQSTAAALTLDEGYLLTATPPDLEHGIAPLGLPVPAQPLLLGRGVAPPGRHPWPQMWGSSCWPFLRRHSLALSAAAPDLRCGVAPFGLQLK